MNESSKVFDRITMLVAVTGVLVMAAILVLVVRGPTAAGVATVLMKAEIELNDFTISGDLAVPVGTTSLRVVNAGTLAHNLTVVGGSLARPAPSDA